ncbi:MAG: small ribosomal subunit Rsm22 family protein [Acidobacteriaceae bacterium]
MNIAWQASVDAEIEKIPPPQLIRAARELSEAYRNPDSAHDTPINTSARRAAYLAVRLPATFAAISSALERLRECAPLLQPVSLLDLGAGPGTASMVAKETFPTLHELTLLERDSEFARISRGLLPSAILVSADLSTAGFPKAELVVCAYALNELAPKARTRVVHEAINAATRAVVFVEPGSRRGFAHILAAREILIADEGFAIAAPCPGHMPCPLEEVGDWCHFAARVQRTSRHRRVKDAALAYEDEKFSYVAAVLVGAQRPESRIVRRPEKLTGHVKLALCTPQGLRVATVTKKHGASYRAARKAEWGDPFHII